jgi:hypothetical protein
MDEKKELKDGEGGRAEGGGKGSESVRGSECESEIGDKITRR